MLLRILEYEIFLKIRRLKMNYENWYKNIDLNIHLCNRTQYIYRSCVCAQ